MKKHSHDVQLDMLEILLVLRIKDVNLDHDKEQEIKEKKLLSHKQNILQMSKREKKVRKLYNESTFVEISIFRERKGCNN